MSKPLIWGQYKRATVLQSLANYVLTRHTRSLQASVLRQVGAKLYRTVALQEQVWTPLVYGTM